jgi:hypothetical protein
MGAPSTLAFFPAAIPVVRLPSSLTSHTTQAFFLLVNTFHSAGLQRWNDRIYPQAQQAWSGVYQLLDAQEAFA